MKDNWNEKNEVRKFPSEASTEEDVEEGIVYDVDTIGEKTAKKTCGYKSFGRLACIVFTIVGASLAIRFVLKNAEESQTESIIPVSVPTAPDANLPPTSPIDVLVESGTQTNPPILNEEVIVQALVDFLPNLPNNFDALMSLKELNTGEHGAPQTAIPTEIGLLTNLKSVFFGFSLLEGRMPSEIGLLTKLEFFSAANNALTGTLPTEVGALTALESFWLSNNSLEGPLPTEIGAMAALQSLYLKGNKFTGTLPTEFGMMSNVEDFYLANNFLRGTIPTQIETMTSLTWFSLSSNELEGSLPTELGSLTALTSLWLSHNSFKGTLPTELGMLTRLEYVNMEFNQLTGRVPLEFFEILSPSNLKLAGNNINQNYINDFIGATPSNP